MAGNLMAAVFPTDIMSTKINEQSKVAVEDPETKVS
jgi:hypothetical protein